MAEIQSRKDEEITQLSSKLEKATIGPKKRSVGLQTASIKTKSTHAQVDILPPPPPVASVREEMTVQVVEQVVVTTPKQKNPASVFAEPTTPKTYASRTPNLTSQTVCIFRMILYLQNTLATGA